MTPLEFLIACEIFDALQKFWADETETLLLYGDGADYPRPGVLKVTGLVQVTR